jgi:hypothetical protein
MASMKSTGSIGLAEFLPGKKCYYMRRNKLYMLIKIQKTDPEECI